MPDESDFKNYKNMEDYAKTVEGMKYLHDLYLKAVNHPIRREILNIVNKGQISKKDLLNQLKENEVLDDENVLNYNVDYLIKAFCVEIVEENNEISYKITKSGEVVNYFK